VTSPVSIIGAPLDLGQSRRGVDMGPSAIRYAGLEERLTGIGLTVSDRGNVVAPEPEALAVHDERARYLPEILDACAALAALVEDCVRDDSRPLVLGGDHSIAMGTLGGLAAAAGQAGGVIWIDAHGDLNTPETSPSGNVHGMPLAAALGEAGDVFASAAWPTPSLERAALVGVRSLDAAERELIGRLNAKVFTMSDIDRHGLERAVRESLEFLHDAAFLHVSLDLDAVDPMFAPGVGTPVPGGLSYREAHLTLELVSESGRLDSLELVEVNPILDRQNETGTLAVELAASALGARIL